MIGRAGVLAAACAGVVGCSPTLGDTPFTCAADGDCPSGYACESTVCVKDGVVPPDARPLRIVWINSAEMYWFAEGGGARLVVNDGFTPSAHGIYTMPVAADGTVGDVRPLVLYGDEFPMSSAVVPIGSDRFGIATLRFPDIDGTNMMLEVLGVPRTPPADSSPAIETLYTDQEPFLGGVEPAYIGALGAADRMDVAWTRPSQGGRVEVVRIERGGSVWTPTRAPSQPLPPGILPLSGDCLLWKIGDDSLAVRVGFEGFAVATIDAAGAMTAFTPLDDVPIYAFSDSLLSLRYGDRDDATSSYRVSYVLTGLDGAEKTEDTGYVLQDGTEPYTGVPFDAGALVAPIGSDPTFPTIGVAMRSPTQALTQVASVARASGDLLYSARALASNGRVYLAWTSFHESLMDLWIAVVPLDASAAKGTTGAAAPATLAPTLVRSFSIEAGSSATRSFDRARSHRGAR